MAGLFITVGNIYADKERRKIAISAEDSLIQMCRYGYYCYNLPIKEKTVTDKKEQGWEKFHLSIFADYFSLKSGDYVFIFSQRKIYGVAKLIGINESNDCVAWSFQGANDPRTKTVNGALIDEIKPENRCVCFFKPVKYYPHAIDMDEALTSFPESFKTLRVIEGRSFIKLDDEEAQALFAVLTKSNEFACKKEPDWEPPEFDDSKQKAAIRIINQNPAAYRFTIESVLTGKKTQNIDGISPEMAIEAALVAELNSDHSSLFNLTYVSRQVSASPAKPVEYMEWIDVFGYSADSFLLRRSIPIQFAIDTYYVFELKKDLLYAKSKRSPQNGKDTKKVRDAKAVAHQLMKYVDWVTKTYANGKYPMVKGIIVANDFDEKFIEYCQTHCVRNYNSGYRDSTPDVWHEIELIKYSFDDKEKKITFSRVYPKNENNHIRRDGG